MNLKTDTKDHTVIALVGLHAIEAALTDAKPGTEICAGTNIPYYRRLSIRSNAIVIRSLLPEADQGLFWELLMICGLRMPGWNIRQLQDQSGILRLWGLVMGLLTHPPILLAIEPMSGMSPRDRDHFAALLRWCEANDVKFTYTAARLKDVMDLNTPQHIRLATHVGWRDTDTLQLESVMADEKEKSWNKIQLMWEEGDNGKTSET